MSNANKNAYLKAMEIDVWLEKNASVDIKNTEQAESIITTSESVLLSTTKEVVESKVVNEIDVTNFDWLALRSHVAQCQMCDLSKTRQQTVFSSDTKKASLMVIAGAPTAEDEQLGESISGEAGKLLSAMLKAMGYQRHDVYISNIVKCRTNDNQEATTEQTTACEPYLLREIALLKPKLILALGNAAAHSLLKSKSSMNRLRGQLHYIDGIKAPVLISYHPTYLLASPNEKRKAWQDLQIAIKELDV